MLPNYILSFLGLAAFAVADTLPGDTCIPTVSTVFVEPSPIYITVTVERTHESTIYVTAPGVSPAPGYPVLEPVKQDDYKAHGAPEYDFTVYETAYVTVTIDESEIPTVRGPLRFVVVAGTTSWLGGETPAPGESLIYASDPSIITVVPQQEAQPTAVESTTPLTSPGLAEVAVTTLDNPTSTSLGSGSFTGKPYGGWNETSVADSYTREVGHGVQSSMSTLATDDIDLYPTTTRSFIWISSYAAQSGFRQFTTLNAPTLTSEQGGSTTAIIDGEILSWTTSTLPPTPGPASPIPPYGNSTLVTSYTDRHSSSASGSVSPTEQVANSTIPHSNPNTTATTSLDPSSVSTSSSPSASSTQCGIIGDFVLNFDDIPPLSIGNQSIDEVQPMPVFNPYKKFKFSKGFVVVPPPRVPYLPSSKPLLLEFIPNFTANSTDNKADPNTREFGWSGDIVNGDLGQTGCFSFNVYGASLGCDSRSDDCIFTLSGSRYDRSTGLTNKVVVQKLVVPACPALKDCPLTTVSFDDTFENLDAVRINVTVAGLPRIWWVDDVRLGWYDNACSTGICRQNTRIR